MKLLYTGYLTQEAINQLIELGFDCIGYKKTALVDEATLVQAIKDIPIYILGGCEIISEMVLSTAEKLQLIVFLGTEPEPQIDTKAAKLHSIQIVALPGANSQAVAEFTVGLILSLQRHIPTHLTKTEGLDNNIIKKGRDLRGSTIGIVGLGNIGCQVARIARWGFGMKVLYWSRHPKPDIERLLDITWSDMTSLLKRSDIITLHIPSSAATKKPLIGPNEFALMKPEAILINTARPNLVDAKALYQALISDTLAGSAVDGNYDCCPELLTLGSEKFIATPHIAWATHDTDITLSHLAVQSIKRWLKNSKI